MSNIYLSNITDKFVINDLAKIIKASGVDLSDVETPNEENWFSIEKTDKSTYHVYTQKGSICRDVTITYDSSRVKPAGLLAKLFIPLADLEYCYEIELVGSDSLVYSVILRSVSSDKILNRKVYDVEKIDGLDTSSLIDKVLNKVEGIARENEMISSGRVEPANATDDMVCHETTYIEESFARACGLDVEDGIMLEDVNNSIIYYGEIDNLEFYLRYKRVENRLYDFTISLVSKISDDARICFDIGMDFRKQISFQARKISKYDEESNISNSYSRNLRKNSSCETILKMVSRISIDPQGALDSYKPRKWFQKVK